MANTAPPKATPVTANTQDVAPKKRANPARRKAQRAKTGMDSPSDTSRLVQALPSSVTRTFSSPTVLEATPTRTTTQVSAALAGKANMAPNKAPTTKAAPRKAMGIPFSPSQSNRGSLALNAPALVTGGLIGCAAGAAIMMAVSVWYDFGGVKAAITAAKAARLCVDTLTDEVIASLSAGTYSTDEALDMLRRTTLAYASAIPDGPPLVERVFREIHSIRQSRGPEVDKILAGAYEELRVAGSKGKGADEMRPIVLKHLNHLSGFANRTLQDVETRESGHQIPTMRSNLTIRHKQAKTP